MRNEQAARGLRALDLFSGAGGLSAGFAWAGGEIVGGVEIDEAAATTFQANHHSVQAMFRDIRETPASEAKQMLGDVDVVLGGPNCQGVSQRGKRDPHDERNFAFWAFCDYVREFEPEYFLMENVPALASDVHNRELAIAVFEELESLGYNVAAEAVCAAWFGVPQLRYRLVVLGARSRPPTFPASVRAGINRELPEDLFTSVGEAIRDLPPIRAGGGKEARAMPAPRAELSPYAEQMREGCDFLFNHWSAATAEINLARIRHVPEGGNWHDIPLDLLPPRFRKVRPSDHTTTYRRLERSHPAHTVTCLCGNITAGAYTHPTQHRAISVREAARLQGFRDSFRFHGPRSSQYRQVGNAVPALMARELIQELIDPSAAAGSEPGWSGRLGSAVLREFQDSRLPFTLSPRYKPLFGQRVHRRRTDLIAA